MAFVHVVDEGHDVYFPEHVVFWVEAFRSHGTPKDPHKTTICYRDENGVITEHVFKCMPSFVPSM